MGDKGEITVNQQVRMKTVKNDSFANTSQN